MKRESIDYISLARVISIIAVVFIHVDSLSRRYDLIGAQFTPIVDFICIFAVPVFFMISGALLLDFQERYDLKTYLFKRISKTVIPFLFWSLFGLLFYVYYLKIVDLSNLLEIFKGLFITADLIPVYWFFIPLFFCYFIVYPIFTKVSNNQKLLKYLIVLSVVFYFMANHFLNFNHRICVYVLFAFAGYYIHKFGISTRMESIIYILAVLGLCLGAAHIVSSADWNQTFTAYYYNASLFCFIYAVFVFVFIKCRLVKLMNYPGFKRTISFLEDYTFSIYLIHWYVLIVLVQFIPFTTLTYFLFGGIMAISISVFLIKYSRKLPFFGMILK